MSLPLPPLPPPAPQPLDETPEQRRQRIFARNLFLTLLAAVLSVIALHYKSESVAGTCLAFVFGLWMHSGRRRPPAKPAEAAPAPIAPPPVPPQ